MRDVKRNDLGASEAVAFRHTLVWNVRRMNAVLLLAMVKTACCRPVSLADAACFFSLLIVLRSQHVIILMFF